MEINSQAIPNSQLNLADGNKKKTSQSSPPISEPDKSKKKLQPSIPDSKLNTLPSAKLNKLNVAQLNKLNGTALNKLNSSQLGKLNAAQLNKVADSKLKTLPDNVLKKLSPAKQEQLGVENKLKDKVSISEKAKVLSEENKTNEPNPTAKLDA